MKHSKYQGPDRVFSGLQPTGQIHLGNYLGALKKCAALQSKYETIYCVVDLHALTVDHDPAILRENSRGIAAALIASGVDPDRSIIFVQSSVAAHAELAWIFNCVARMGWLERMTQFKDKAGKDKQRASVGLFAYPALQAADILAYKATHVPVGDDQRQHLELSRDIAQKFNLDYQTDHFFPLPESLIDSAGARIMSLKDGTKKMSKSDPSELSRIHLNDEDDVIAKKIKKAKSDPEPLPSDKDGLSDRAEARNLVDIFSALTDEPVDDILARFGGKGFGEFKPALTEAVIAQIEPVRRMYNNLLADPEHLDSVLEKGGQDAAKIANQTLTEVRQITGIWPRCY